ncbi:hypothetical protein BDZ89DRAFT_403005 [Hymenopellis radicata]|nr:hypothetical protein BDZ89DRAFT_403005 [Hymenopellis radicata]
MSTVTTLPAFAFSSPEEWSDLPSDEGRRYHCTLTMFPHGSTYGEGPTCGLGWNFCYRIRGETIYQSAVNQATLEIFFFPGPISSFPLDPRLRKVDVRTSAEVLVNGKAIVKPGAASFTLPRNNEQLTLTSHLFKKGFTIAHLERIVLDINISLLRAPHNHTAAITPIQNPSHSALILQTLNGHNMVDTAFILSTGNRLKEVYGISSLLRGKSTILDSVLDGRMLDGSVVGWDYDDDSDLEDDDDAVVKQIGLGLTDMGSDSGSGASTTSASTAAEDLPYVPLTADAVHEIADAAYKTWRGMMQFIYTGTVAFAHIGDRSSERPSPKSMYRLADSLGIPQLKEKALSTIQDHLNTQNVVQEAFSLFTSRSSGRRDRILKGERG